MDALRKKRYDGKIEYVKKSLTFIRRFGDDELSNRGILYSIQVSIESIVDLVAMLIKDLGIIVSDDEKNINSLVKELNWDKKLGEKLIRANGLRNVIVHQYNGIQENIINTSMMELKGDLSIWLQHIQEGLDRLEVD